MVVENEYKLIDKSHESRLRSIARRIIKANNELIEMGYTSYLSTHGNWNVMNGDSHGHHQEALYENVVFNFVLSKIDAGDW